eukprot:CAMPEP_0172439154 /NCGR_PEP_ID=MMETSP1065-20121228/232_1 /TAXON_ID=265537 /ORGANISM="Amphiprora paludosa, Strain CCMP125" /LENGTH=62 /DNA_ID=CAMNT_0013187795 /DNA_START=58 /DNA_END=246 /DNA_ORIENTATION=+
MAAAAEEEQTTPLGYAIMALKILFAFAPLLALGAVLSSAFEAPEEEQQKRKKKDFDLDGHGE